MRIRYAARRRAAPDRQDKPNKPAAPRPSAIGDIGDALPLFAVQNSAPGRWLVIAPSDDPLLPAVISVKAIAA